MDQEPIEYLVSGYESFFRGIIQRRISTDEWRRTANLEVFHKYSPQQTPLLTDDQIREIFDTQAPIYAAPDQIADQKSIMRNLLSFGVRNTRTLSVGCGMAQHEIFLASQGLIQEEIVATDFSEGMLARGKELAQRESIPNISFQVTAGDKLEFKGEFGQAFIIDSLHWMKDWRECLTRTAQALQPGGRLFVLYSPYSPRIQIDGVLATMHLMRNGLDVKDVKTMESSVATIRMIIEAEKTSSPSL